MIFAIGVGIALAAVGFVLAQLEFRDGASVASDLRLWARVAQSTLGVTLIAALLWSDWADVAAFLASGWLVGSLIGSVWAFVRRTHQQPAVASNA